MHEVLLREVKILLVLRINVHLRKLPSENLTILSVVGGISAHLQRHRVQFLEFQCSLLGLFDSCHFRRGKGLLRALILRSVRGHVYTCVNYVAHFRRLGLAS